MDQVEKPKPQPFITEESAAFAIETWDKKLEHNPDFNRISVKKPENEKFSYYQDGLGNFYRVHFRTQSTAGSGLIDPRGAQTMVNVVKLSPKLAKKNPLKKTPICCLKFSIISEYGY